MTIRTILLLVLLLTSADVAWAQISTEHVERLKGLVGEVANHGVTFQADAKIETAEDARRLVDSMSWHRLLGESLVSEHRAFSLWSTAADSFATADEAWRAGQDDRNKDVLKKLLESERVMAMKYEIVDGLVRKGERAERAGKAPSPLAARKMEKERIDQLRRLAVSYSTMIHQMAVADYALESGSEGVAAAALEESVRESEKIVKLVAERTSDPDYYLFEQEPAAGKAGFVPQTVPPRPIRVGVVPRVRALQALSLFRLATRNGLVLDGERRAWQMKLLAQAIDSAKLALEKESGALPSDSKDDSLAELAWGWSALALGLLEATEPANKYSADVAKLGLFDEAKAHLTAAKTQLPANTALSERITQLVDQLDKPASFHVAALVALEAGDSVQAFHTIRQAAVRHRDPLTWRLYFETALRAGAPIDEIRSGFQLVFPTPKSDPEVMLLDMRIAVEDVWRRLAKRELAAMTPVERERVRTDLRARLDQLYAMLAPTTDLAKDPILRPRFEATCASLIQLSDLMSEKASFDDRFLGLVEDSREPLHREAERLEKAIADLPAGSPERTELTAALYRIKEARIGLFLAVGHMATRYLIKDGKHVYEDAMIGYQAAYDEIATLPYSVPRLNAFGSPVLAGLEVVGDYSPDGGLLVLREERARRSEMEKLIQAVFAMQFAPTASADQIGKAFDDAAEHHSGKPAARLAFLNLSAMRDEREFEVKFKAFALLSRIKSVYLMDVSTPRGIERKKAAAQIAYEEAISLGGIHAQGPTITGSLQAADLAALNDPIIAYLIAKAIDCRVSSFHLTDPKDARQPFIASFDVARQRLEDIVSRRSALRERYRDLIADIRGNAKLYQGDVLFAKELDIVFSETDDRDALVLLDYAIERIAFALQRSPDANGLWELYFQTQLEKYRRLPTDELVRRIEFDLDAASQQKLVPPHNTEYFRGLLLEASGKKTEATKVQTDAAKLAEQSLKVETGKKDELTARYLQAAAKAVELEFGLSP